MDNYLKISDKLYNLRTFLENSHGDMFERKMYLELIKLEDTLGITQCVNCGSYGFVNKLEPSDNKEGGVDLYCIYCML